MPSSSFGSNTKGGAAVCEPSPTGTTETVHGGRAGGAVYSGAAPGGAEYAAPAIGQLRATPVVATAQGSPAATHGARIFFLIAAFTVINVVMMFAGIRFAIGLSTTSMNDVSLNGMLALSIMGAGIFVALGMFARDGSKVAFLSGMTLYAGDLLVLVLNHPETHIISIVIHGLFLFYLFAAFRKLPE